MLEKNWWCYSAEAIPKIASDLLSDSIPCENMQMKMFNNEPNMPLNLESTLKHCYRKY